jgi:hypothetical protein
MKSFIRTGIALALLGTLLTGSIALADSDHDHGRENDNDGNHVTAILTVHQNGTTVTGNVQGIGSTTLALSTNNGVWTVLTTATTTYDHKIGFSNIQTGDKLAVRGTVQGSTTIITASHINDSSITEREHDNKKSFNKMMKNFRKQAKVFNQPLKVTAVGSSTITVSGKHNTSLIINTDSNTRFYNLMWLPVNLGNILVGNKIQTFGSTTNSTSMNAVLIHDLSL